MSLALYYESMCENNYKLRKARFHKTFENNDFQSELHFQFKLILRFIQVKAI